MATRMLPGGAKAVNTGGILARAAAYFHATRERAHPLIRLSYLPRFVALTFGGVALCQFENRPWTTFDTVYFSGALLAPHLWFFGSVYLWNTRAAGRLAMLGDAALNGAVAALYGGTREFIVPFVLVTLTNAISVGGAVFMLEAGVTMAVTGWALVHALPRSFIAGRLSPGGEFGTLVFLAFYMCLSAFSMRGQARRINVMRKELAASNDLLEARVAERTQALAATNAAISRFVPREFLNALGHDDVTTVRLGDVSAREVTILFADIRNFTARSERLSPEATFRFLNDCLSRIGPHIRAQAGFIDKYVGDAIMAIFTGSPADGVRAAMAMQNELKAYHSGKTGDPPLAIGVGVHVGPVMMGTIGEAQRFEATVISDAVNLAARLESLTAHLGCAILVSAEVAKHLSADESRYTRSAGSFVLKGRANPVEIIEVFACDDPALRNAKLASRGSFAKALADYTHDAVGEARLALRELSAANPADGPVSWWLARVERDVASDGPASGRMVVYLDSK